MHEAWSAVKMQSSIIAGNAGESAQRSDVAEVMATSEGTGDDAVNSMLYCIIIEACVRSLQAATGRRRSSSKSSIKSQHHHQQPRIARKHMENLLQALDCEQPTKSRLMKMEPLKADETKN
jgi:hypothetical protein